MTPTATTREALEKKARELSFSMKHSAGQWMVPGWDGYKCSELIDALLTALSQQAAAGETEGAPGDTDAERAAWLADKIAALGDYAREAAAMLQRWPVSAEEARALLSKAAIQLRLHNAHGNHRTDPAFIEDIVRTAAGVSAEEALDAARLDWLERQDLNELVTMRRRTNGDVGVNVGRGPFFGKTLREALDAARGEERKAS